jgi:transmembrane 9 superfamily protein 2/4
LAKEKTECKVLCQKTLTKKEVKQLAEYIEQEYRVHWLVDNLPAATKIEREVGDTKQVVYEAGFPLGEMVPVGNTRVPVLNNHVAITILYHEDVTAYLGIRVVGFEVKADSIQHSTDFDPSKPDQYPSSCLKPPTTPQFMNLEVDTNVVFTYSVDWVQSENKWASRWDSYLMMTDDQIHWFSIINSVMIVFFLTGMVAMIMMRTLHADLRRYQEMENSEEAQEETGWKLVHGDVFRAPNYSMLLAVSVGNGVQVLLMTVFTMVFAVLGFLSPANRGGLMTAVVVLLVLLGVFSGYFSTRVYKIFKGKAWKKNALMTALLYPSILFTTFMVLNFLVWEQKSGAVPFTALLQVLALWLFVSVPLNFLGSYFAFKKPVPDPPVRVNQIPRQIPEQVWYMKPLFSILMGGILPFGAIFIELFFILSSIWLHKFYYLFGFLFIVFIILVLTCAEITIVMCYFQLCSEDYHWWWRAFLTSGASALYVFAYSIFYFFTKLQITKFVSAVLYFGYTFIISLEFFLLTGTIGFYACYFFVRKIYGSVKVD